MDRAPVVFLRGGPAVGKSTLARALADRIRRSAVIEQDVLRYMVRGGLVACRSGRHPSEDPDEYEHQCGIGDANAIAVARIFANEGITPIIAGFDGGESARSFRSAPEIDQALFTPSKALLERSLPGLTIRHVLLDASPSVLRERLVARGHDQAAIQFVLDQRDRFLRRIPPDLAILRVSTDATDVDAAARYIIEKARLDEGKN